MKQLDLFDSLAKDDKAKKEKQAAYQKAYREANKEKIAAYDKAYYEANKEKLLALQKVYYEANREQLLGRQKAYKKAYYAANREKILARYKDYYEDNKEELNACSKAHYEANKEKILALQKVWNAANQKKNADYSKAYRKNNKEKVASWSAKRRASKLKQIPVHLRDCPQEKQRLLQTYKLSKILTQATGVQHHVDHMWPLNDGGPHWSGNLQVITAQENNSKHASVCEATKSTIIKSLESFQSERTI